MSNVSRRAFLRKSLALAGATFAIGAAGRKVLGANERIRIGVAGIGGRGGDHVAEYLRMKDVEVAYLIDVDSRRGKGGVGRAEGILIKELEKQRGYKEHQVPKEATDAQKAEAAAEKARHLEEFRKLVAPRLPKCVQDVREALDDKALDALSIATPNHWHALMTIWAVQAGKDVYVEKPCSHNVYEGRIATEVIARSKQVVQTGTQRRSEERWARMVELTRSGKLGKLLVSHGISSKARGSIKFAQPEEPPKELNFDLWLGPAPNQPYHRNLVHYNWHWFWDFGSGEIGNQGVHQTDVARWAIPGATHPKSVLSIGGRFGYVDQAQTPNTQLTIYDYGDTLMVFEVCGLVDGKTMRVSNDFLYEAGLVRDGTKFFPKDGGGKEAPLPKLDVKLGPGGSNFGNFIAAVRSRKTTDLNAPYLEGHYSAAICHLGNISYRLGKEVELAKEAKPFGECTYANDAWERLKKHLADNRKLKLEEMKLRLGRPLRFDTEKEKFIDDPEADKLLTREYRKPYVVPEKA